MLRRRHTCHTNVLKIASYKIHHAIAKIWSMKGVLPHNEKDQSNFHDTY